MGAVPRTLFSLVLAVSGGAVAAAWGLPLAWLIGAMLAVASAALLGLRPELPPPLRTWMVAVLGVLLGSQFRPELLAAAGAWLPSLALLPVYAALGIALGMPVLRRVVGLSGPTAFFSAAPGGFGEMVTAGEGAGGDPKTIALTHVLRIAAVVLLVPTLFRLSGLEIPATMATPPGPTPGAAELALLALCLVFWPVALWARIPAAPLVGPMLASAALHLANVSHAAPPVPLVVAAQLVLGAGIGVRFAGATGEELRRTLWAGLLITLLLMALSLVFATLLWPLTEVGFLPLLLAYAPGGLTEMSLIALALQADPAFVATHHVVRIVLIVSFVPGLWLLLRGRT